MDDLRKQSPSPNSEASKHKNKIKWERQSNPMVKIMRLKSMAYIPSPLND
jgi:hypothetical protein